MLLDGVVYINSLGTLGAFVGSRCILRKQVYSSSEAM